MSNSLTIKESENRKEKISSTYDKMFRAMCESKNMKNSGEETKPLEGEVRRTKKKFNLTSTSSTLEHFSERWRSTVGKKSNRVQEKNGNSNEPCIHSSPLIP
jgi:hypothetical protein